MFPINNLDFVDRAVEEHQLRIQEAARDARGDRHRSSGGIERHSLRIRLGDRLIALGEAVRGGFPDAPLGRHRELSPHS